MQCTAEQYAPWSSEGKNWTLQSVWCIRLLSWRAEHPRLCWSFQISQVFLRCKIQKLLWVWPRRSYENKFHMQRASCKGAAGSSKFTASKETTCRKTYSPSSQPYRAVCWHKGWGHARLGERADDRSQALHWGTHEACETWDEHACSGMPPKLHAFTRPHQCEQVDAECHAACLASEKDYWLSKKGCPAEVSK